VRSLDEFLPDSEFAARHGVAVAADPDRVDAALREVTFREVPVVRALLFARGLRAGRGSERVLAAMRRRATEAPATAVVDFRAGPGSLTTESRIHVPVPESRRKFARYWRVVRPFSGLTRAWLPRAAKRRAESA